MRHASLSRTTVVLPALVGALALVAPAWAGPFATGATAAQINVLTILTPIAGIAIMVLGVARADVRRSTTGSQSMPFRARTP